MLMKKANPLFANMAGWKLWPVSHLITYGVIGDPSRGRAKAPFGVVIPMRNPGLGYLKPQQKPPLRKRNKVWAGSELENSSEFQTPFEVEKSSAFKTRLN
nr:hypothetical protein Itr_chr14CG26900 [Ipomoea trifida]GLL47921.1 hypothetical protein Itr_chr14CG26950 [Ipomoea trifida]